MNTEIARDVTAAQPIAPDVRQLLLQEQVADPFIERRVSEQQQLIRSDLDRIGVMLSMSAPLSMDFDPYVHEEEPQASALAEFAAQYDELRRDPTLKHEFDTNFVENFLRLLGPTNHLRRKDGIDAAFELGQMAHLLKTDYDNLPDNGRHPEARVVEALIAEEQALLWAPTIIQKAQNLSDMYKGLIFNAEDPNVFSPMQITTISQKDRWKVIGVQLSSEAASLFQSIAESETDMRIRQLNILASMENDKNEKQKLRDEVVALSLEDLNLALSAWQDPKVRQCVKTGKLYEFLALAKKRYETILVDPTHTLRMALPREDRVNEKIYPFYNRKNEKINLSVDLVEEDSNGNFVRGFQVKSMAEDRYRAKMADKVEAKGGVIYPEKRIEMIFLEDEELQKELVS
jgi:hypothetical protein